MHKLVAPPQLFRLQATSLMLPANPHTSSERLLLFFNRELGNQANACPITAINSVHTLCLIEHSAQS